MIDRWNGWKRVIVVFLACTSAGGCATFGPQALDKTRLKYNEIVKATTEEQLLLNIVRLRYTDTPSSLAISAAQYHDYWFYIDETDQDTKSTFSFLVELARLELAGGKSGPGPVLTLPLGGR